MNKTILMIVNVTVAMIALFFIIHKLITMLN